MTAAPARIAAMLRRIDSTFAAPESARYAVAEPDSEGLPGAAVAQ
jgi:hypothetical protein